MVSSPIPSFEDWYNKDAKKQGDPTTPFGTELKKVVRERGETLNHLRAAVNEDFHLTTEQMDTFQKEILAILNESLEQKDYWLTIHGDVKGDFYCEWFPKFTLPRISSVTLEKKLDLWFTIQCADFQFRCILRWGKGVGFSNLRIDARD